MGNIYTLFPGFLLSDLPDWLAQQPRLRGALASIMAAVVGVIANLFVWFALHLFFDKTKTLDLNIVQILVPNFASLDWQVTAIAILCGWLALWCHIGLLWLLGIAGLAGILSGMINIS